MSQSGEDRTACLLLGKKDPEGIRFPDAGLGRARQRASPRLSLRGCNTGQTATERTLYDPLYSQYLKYLGHGDCHASLGCRKL